MKVDKLRITLVNGRFEYNAEAIEAGGRCYYRIGATTVEVTKHEYDRVIANPRLYYFSTALKLHKLTPILAYIDAMYSISKRTSKR